MYNQRPLPVAPMEGNDSIDTEINWNEFVRLLQETNREGAKDLLNILDTKTDFKIAPASHKHHLAVKGGLCLHSLNVCKYAHELNSMIGLDLPKDSLTIASLLHDLCKIHFYKISNELDKEYKEKTGEWRKRQMYIIDDKFPAGHGAKSVILAQQYGVKLNTDEVLSIVYHMGFSDISSQSISFKQAWKDSPLVQIIAMADQLSVTHEDHIFMKENKNV